MTKVVSFQTVTPSGVEIAYESEPRRHYKVRALCGQCPQETTGDDCAEKCSPFGQWKEVPSVTTVLEVLDKPALPWWGMKIGVQGVLELAARNLFVAGEGIFGYQGGAYKDLADEGKWKVAGADELIDLLKSEKLTVNHVRDSAGARGQACHDAFEEWAKTGERPDPEMFPEEEKGYIVGLNAFLDDAQPEPLACEVMVGSVEHGYAGRYDVRLKITEERRVVFHRTPVKGPQYAIVQPGTVLGDLKTSKGVYPSHSRQLEAYEQASVECGYEPTVARGIIHVNADGTYEFVRSKAEFEDFRVVLDVWRSDKRMAARKR